MPARFILLAVCVCMATACARREQKTAKPGKRLAIRTVGKTTQKTNKTESKNGKRESTVVAEVPKKANGKEHRGEKEKRGEEKKQKTVVITAQRTYRLEVEKLDPTLNATFTKQGTNVNAEAIA